MSGISPKPFRTVATFCGNHKLHWFTFLGSDNAFVIVDDLTPTSESRVAYMTLDMAGQKRFAFYGFADGTLVHRGIPMLWTKATAKAAEPWLLALFANGASEEAP